jgi:uncharacterized delta-60 repeat protein
MKYLFILFFSFSATICGQALDPTFASNGIFQLASIKKAHDIAVDSAQNIYVAGETQDTEFVLLKLTPDGQIDTSFGVNGFVNVSTYRWAKKIIFQDNKIVVLGNSLNGFGVLRFTINGQLDTSFGNNGVFHYSSNDYYVTHSLFLFQDGVLVCGEDWFQGQARVVLNKLTENGAIDMSYGNNGIVTSFFNAGGSVRGFDTDEFDNIYAFGREMIKDWRVAKYDSNGISVQSFGNHSPGVSIISFGNYIQDNTTPYHIIVRENKVFVSGEIRIVVMQPATTFTYSHIIKMDSSTGLFDTSFGGNGSVSFTGNTIEPGLIYYYAGRSFLLDDAGRVILGGVSRDFPDETIMRKLNQDGSIGLEEVMPQYLALNNSYSFQFGNKILAAGVDFANNQLIITRHVDGVLNIDETQIENKINIYPNPASDFFKLTSNKQIQSVKIYNLLGVLELDFSAMETYDVSNLVSGLYLVTIVFDGGVKSFKLIVK